VLVLATLFLSACGVTTPDSAESMLAAGGQRFASPVMTFQEIRSRQILRQKYDFTCGSAALATVLHFQYGENISEQVIIREILAHGKSVEEAKHVGFSLLDLKQFLERHGYVAQGFGGVKTADLMRHNVPAIVPVDMSGYKHFVVIRDVRGGTVHIANPALGNQSLSVPDFEKVWQNNIAFYVFPPGGPAAVTGNRMAAISADETSVDYDETLLHQFQQPPGIMRYNLEDRLRIAR
jgi:predicted double-glycine peptidase